MCIRDSDLNCERILRELSAKSGQTILKGDTLLIFDEIQSCERALTSLKYFCEEMCIRDSSKGIQSVGER